jgi:hypothetical protein
MPLLLKEPMIIVRSEELPLLIDIDDIANAQARAQTGHQRLDILTCGRYPHTRIASV